MSALSFVSRTFCSHIQIGVRTEDQKPLFHYKGRGVGARVARLDEKSVIFHDMMNDRNGSWWMF